MKKHLIHIIPLAFMLLVWAGMYQTGRVAWKKFKRSVDTGAEITILPADKTYILPSEVKRLLQQTDTSLLRTNPWAYVHQAESVLYRHPMVAGGQVWLGPGGRLHVRIRQIQPIGLTDIGGRRHYLTAGGKIIPVSPHQKVSLPVLKGVHSAGEARDYFPLIRYIYNQPDLRHQIGSLEVQNGRLWMHSYRLPVPVLLGDTTGYRQKLYKYRILTAYMKGKERQNPYTKVDLRFKNQIIWTKNL